MTETSPDRWTIAEMLDALADCLSSDEQERPAEAGRQLDAITDALTQCMKTMGVGAQSGTDYLTLNSVRDTLHSEIGSQLATAAAADWESMAKACTDERQAIGLLEMKPKPKLDQQPDLLEPPLPAWTITLRRCTIKDGRIFTEYTRPDRPGAGATQGIGEYRLSKALAFLYANGIQSLEYENGGGLEPAQFKWLANAIRKVFIDCNSRVNLVVKMTMCVPASDFTMYAHLSFYEHGTCRIHFEPFPALVVFGSRVDVAVEKLALVELYGLNGITEEDGAAWTAVELHQLGSALAKVPAADRIVVRGLTFVRKKSAPDDSEMTEEAGSYRFSNRTTTLLDAGFSERDYGFIGIADDIGPYSHWTILHEVGHAVEKYLWEMDYRRWDSAGIRQEISQLQARKQALQAGVDLDTASRIRELEEQILELTMRAVEYNMKQVEMVNALRRNQSSSKCLQAFVSLVNAEKIPPCTGYAFQSWNERHGEFFAESYSLFLNDPWFIKKVSADLYDWFATGGYRASW